MNQSRPDYLLDTDWVINYLADREPHSSRIEELGVSDIGISAATAAELYEGVFFSRDLEDSLARLEEFLRGGVIVVPMIHEIAIEVGRERGRLRRDGIIIGDFDLVIGCTARYHRIPLCTDNRRHFERIEGLEIISMPS